MPESPDKNGKERLVISENPLINSVYKERNHSPKEINQGLEIIAEREVERRYLPARLLTPTELWGMKGVSARTIEQKYIWALKSKEEVNSLVRFRLRKTHTLSEDGEGKEEAFRIAYKRKSKKNRNARFEVQRVIRGDVSEDENERRSFVQLWRQGESSGSMTRFYIPHTFSRLIMVGKKVIMKECNCEIHYEIRRTPRHLRGFVRIEVEFESDEDEAYAEMHKDVLPDWIGEDVTTDSRYKSAALQSTGIPEDARKLMKNLSKKGNT